MNCSKCGLELKENENVCPVCQTNSEVVVEKSSDKYGEYKENEQLKRRYGFDKLLIFSIVEICCCNQIFGLAAVILLFLKLKTAIEQRNFEEADKWKRNIKLILLVGLFLGIFLGVFEIVISLLPMLIELV